MQNPAVLLPGQICKLIPQSHLTIQTPTLLLFVLWRASVGMALCLWVKLSDSNVMTPRNLSAGTKIILQAAKRWSWVMHHISLKRFCFLSKQMGDETLPFGHKSVYGNFEEEAFLLEQLLFYKHCIVRAVSSISAAVFLHSISDVRLFSGLRWMSQKKTQRAHVQQLHWEILNV